MPEQNADDAQTRFLVRILSWDWPLHVGLAPKSMSKEARFQGGLLYAKGLDIRGEILAPEIHGGKVMQLAFVLLAPDLDLGKDELPDIGQLYERRNDSRGTDFEAVVLLPHDALPTAVTCLASVWKFIHLWVVGDLAIRGALPDFSFSSVASEGDTSV